MQELLTVIFVITLFNILAKKVRRYNHTLKYKTLCDVKGRHGKSLCKEPDDEKLGIIIKEKFLDQWSNKEYNFTKNTPDLRGQIGVPKIVDEILGNIVNQRRMKLPDKIFSK